MRYFAIIIFISLFLPSGVMAQEPSCSSDKWGEPFCISVDSFETDVCRAIQTVTNRHGLDTNFFARLIWQESRFNPNARSHANAQGIAQFIPSTAKIRGLKDPWNPAEALDESARYLALLVKRFGNEGMAAAAYNAGETRVGKFKAGSSGLPTETRNYVQIITNINAEIWRDTPPANRDFALAKDKEFIPACLDLAQKRIYTKYKSRPTYAPWGVQMAAGSTRSKAKASYRRRSAQCKNVLRGKSVSYIYKRSPSRGGKAVYNARIGFSSRSKATKYCLRLKKSGCVCAVYKN